MSRRSVGRGWRAQLDLDQLDVCRGAGLVVPAGLDLRYLSRGLGADVGGVGGTLRLDLGILGDLRLVLGDPNLAVCVDGCRDRGADRDDDSDAVHGHLVEPGGHRGLLEGLGRVRTAYGPTVANVFTRPGGCPEGDSGQRRSGPAGTVPRHGRSQAVAHRRRHIVLPAAAGRRNRRNRRGCRVVREEAATMTDDPGWFGIR